MLFRATALGCMVAVLGVLVACSRVERPPAQAHDVGGADTLRLGYIPDVTHAAALIGMDQKFLESSLQGTELVSTQFSAGPNEAAALLGGSLDAALLGSAPAISAHARSDGEAIRLVSGAASGGVSLVARDGIDTPDELPGHTIATPEFGNSQDVAAKTWLDDHGLRDEVAVTNTPGPQILSAFRSGSVDGAWVPEPWASQLVDQEGAHRLVDESLLWPGSGPPGTVLAVRTEFLQKHPETVRQLVRGLADAIDWSRQHRERAELAVRHQLRLLTRQTLPRTVLTDSFDHMRLTTNPYPNLFPRLAQDRVTAGATENVPNVDGLVTLDPLRDVRGEEYG